MTKNYAELIQGINQGIPDNDQGLVSPADIRVNMIDLADWANELPDIENVKGAYNASTNSPTLTATPDPTFNDGAYYDVTVSGAVSFSGENFTSGTVLNVGDKLKKKGTQWYLIAFDLFSLKTSIYSILNLYETLKIGKYYVDQNGNIIAYYDKNGHFIPSMLKPLHLNILNSNVTTKNQKNNTFIWSFQDASNNIILGLKRTGEFISAVFGFNKLKNKINGFEITSNDNSYFELSDSNGNSIFRVNKLFEFVANTISSKKIKIGIGKYSSYIKENNNLLYSILDKNGNVIYGIKPNGKQISKVKITNTANLIYISEYIKSDILGTDSYGQSNSIGGGISGLVSISQKYNSLMPAGGVRADIGGDFSGVRQLYETNESPISQLSEGILDLFSNKTGLNKWDFRLVCSSSGKGGQTIAQLSKGTDPYNRLLNAVAKMKGWASRIGLSYNFPFILYTQGESDVDNSTEFPSGTPYQVYYDRLIQLITDINVDIKAITGQVNNIPFFSYQTNWYRLLPSSGYIADRQDTKICIAQKDLAINNPLFTIVCPSYQFDYCMESYIYLGNTYYEMVHFTPTYRAVYGRFLARAIAEFIINKRKFTPLYPKKYSWNTSNNVLSVSFNMPEQNSYLVLDTATVSNPGDYGIEIFNSSGVKITLSNIRILNDNTLEITCSENPTGGKFAIARQIDKQNILDVPNLKAKMGARSCIRASSYIEYAGQKHYDFCLAVYDSIN